jgi:hypothetical protein
MEYCCIKCIISGDWKQKGLACHHRVIRSFALNQADCNLLCSEEATK